MTRLWQHDIPGERRCDCDFPRIWTAYPDECQNCMKLLPGVEASPPPEPIICSHCQHKESRFTDELP